MPPAPATLAHEEAVRRAPYALSGWLSYITHASSRGVPPHALFALYERAVGALPGSYKLWRLYASAFDAHAATRHPSHPARSAALSVSLRAARALRASPVLWAAHIRRACAAARWRAARAAVNAALRALPPTQHAHVWRVVAADLLAHPRAPPAACGVLLRRYATHTPAVARERLFFFLRAAGRHDAAVAQLAAALADPRFRPAHRERKQLWLELARAASQAGPAVGGGVDVPALLRAALRETPADAADLWVALAGYYTRAALFEHAAAVYEHAMAAVCTARDFALVFDAYAKFLEALVVVAMPSDRDAQPDDNLLELRMARLEYLTNRRPMLLSDVMLRQNPHNVHQWHKRARMFKAAHHPANVVDTYTKALQAVHPSRATNGRPHTLWLAFARYYEDAADLSSARRVLDNAVDNPDAFRSAEDLAAVWCEYAEMHLRCTTPHQARQVLLRATAQPPNIRNQLAKRRRGETQSNVASVAAVGAGAGTAVVTHQYDNASPAWNAYKSRRVWHFLIDVTQSIAMPHHVIQLHQQMLDLRIASPQTILSGAQYLESKRLYEQAFRLYDKAVSVIPWPDALQVWVVYLSKIVKRFGSRKLERARDLFEEAIRSAPTSKRAGVVYPNPQLRVLYLMYADMEERHSLARHALNIYARAAKAVREEERPDMYRLYIVKLATMFGVTKTRPVYEEALSSLTSPEDVLDFAVRYAEMETRIGEIDRARAIYAQTCGIADPRRRGIYEVFWSSWNDFELTHGSEDTFRDMLREKREVQLNHKGIIVETDLFGVADGGALTNMVKASDDSEMKDANGDNVNASTKEGEDKEQAVGQDSRSALAQEARSTTAEANDEEIAIDLSDDDDAEDAAHANVADKAEVHGQSPDASRQAANESDGPRKPLKIVQKELPAAVRQLVAAAHASHSQKRKRDSEDEGPNGKAEDDGDVKPLGALARFKRRR